MSEIASGCEAQMKKKMEALERDLSRVRTGRANIQLIDGVRVNYYGTPTLINQVASLSTPDARTIVIAPFEKKLIPEIEKAIQIADIGIQPTNDGNVIRLPILPLNEERRKEIAKSIKKIGEEAKVGVRMVRQEANGKVKKMEKAKELAEDESKKLQKEVQDQTDRYIKVIDEKIAKKEKEVLSI